MIKRVLLLTSHPNLKFLRQTPEGKGRWGDWQFYENEEIDDCDAVVVFNSVSKPLKVNVAIDNVFLVTAEPPSVLSYTKKYCSQFSHVISSQSNIQHSGLQVSHTALPWHIGLAKENSLSHRYKSTVMTYDDFSNNEPILKNHQLSLITSAKNMTAGHRARLSFAHALKDVFGDQLGLYGAGVNFCEDKWEAMAPYRYHVVIENCSIPHYWTEKLADTYLAGCYPFYSGCTNILDYFPANSLTQIDIKKPEESINTIMEVMEAGSYEKNKNALQEAKRLVLDRYNLFPFLAENLDNLCSFSNSPKRCVSLKPLPVQKHTLGKRLRDLLIRSV